MLLLQSVFNGMHVVFVPYALMKVDPASWMKMVTRFKGEQQSSFMQDTSMHSLIATVHIDSSQQFTAAVTFTFVAESKVYAAVCTASLAIVKSRDMHWALLAQKDHKDINLTSLRMLLVADGANPCECSLVSLYNYLLCSNTFDAATH